MATRSKWQRLATEAVNPRSRGIDTMVPDEIVEMMILDNRAVLAAIQREKSPIAQLCVWTCSPGAMSLVAKPMI